MREDLKRGREKIRKMTSMKALVTVRSITTTLLGVQSRKKEDSEFQRNEKFLFSCRFYLKPSSYWNPCQECSCFHKNTTMNILLNILQYLNGFNNNLHENIVLWYTSSSSFPQQFIQFLRFLGNERETTFPSI